jgi:hypothetical protein
MTPSNEADPRQPIRSRLATRIAVPPVAAFLLLSTYVVAEALGFRGLARPEAATVSEAAALGHAARALELIAAGQNPTALAHVRAGILDSGAYDLTALEGAILGRHVELVHLLQRKGAAGIDTARAICFARARLPEVLSDLGVEQAPSSDSPTDIATAVNICGKERVK